MPATQSQLPTVQRHIIGIKNLLTDLRQGAELPESNPSVARRFEVRGGVTMDSVADGDPLVVVRRGSEWLLEDTSVVRELSKLNSECRKMCEEMRSGPTR